MTPERPKVPTLREAAERVLLPCSREGFYSSEPVPRDLLADLRDALAADEELHDEIVAVLRECEHGRCGHGSAECPVCDEEQPHHASTCRLAAVLHRLEPQ